MTIDLSHSSGFIPVMRPMLPTVDRVHAYLARVDNARIYSNNGPLVRELEGELAEMCRVDRSLVVVTANATIALEGACALAPVTRFVVPSFTFPASAHAVLRSGKALTLADIDPIDWQVRANSSTDHGVMRVMPFGASPELEKDRDAAYTIVDAAASLGAKPLDLSGIRSTQCVVFSLHATKVLGAGEGGAIVFGNPSDAARFRAWINFGFAGSRESQFPSTNGKLSEFGAAYALAALSDRDAELREWESVNERAASISAAHGISSPVSGYAGVSPYWIIELPDTSTTDQLERHLHSAGIETRRWWGRGCHRMPAFSSGCDARAFPVTDQVGGRTIGLPMFRDMTDAHFTRIQRALSAFSKA